MPGFLTHYIAGKAVLNGVSPEIRKKIADERLFNLGTQGPDIFFYYIPGQVLKRSRGIAQQMHLGGLGLFLGYMARLSKEAEHPEKDTIFAYTAGFLMHYVVDCHAHPYVYAMAFNKNAPKIKNSADHRKFETAIDVALLKLVSGKKPAGINQWELINACKNRLSVSAAALSEGISSVYGRNVPPKTVRRAMKFTINATRFLQSKNGRRKRFMEILENISIREPLYSSMVHMQEISGDRDYLNVKKSPWRTPWAKEDEHHNDSFMERYHAAVEEGTEMLKALYEFVYGDLPPSALAEKIGNRSLKTGMSCGA
ncbi:MAG: zinc dependent phospholipase C family protein [Clostridiales bacterium]|nr:zinc dependent phospholipase C family protein [Clostridiales bacterium]